MLLKLLNTTLLLSCMTLTACRKKDAAPTAASPSNSLTYNNIIISSPTTWSQLQVTVTGTLKITNTGSFTLDGTTLLFSPTVEDTGSFVITGGAFIVKNASLIKVARESSGT
jgi:hypothetical protein